MARESQRYQVGLIICVMLIVILIALSFFLWRNGNDLAQQLQAEKGRVSEAQQAETKLNTQVQYLMAMLGVGDTTIKGLEQSGLVLPEPLQAAKTQFDNDMKMFGQGFPEAQQNYISIVKNLYTSVNKVNAQLVEANNQVRAANEDRDRKVAEMTERVSTAVNGQQEAAKNLEAATAQFSTERQEYIAASQTNATQIDELTTQKDDIQKSALEEAKNAIIEGGVEGNNAATDKLTWASHKLA